MNKKNVYAANENCVCCGTCVDMCPNGCIIAKRKPIYIDRDRCLGCGLCASVCDHDAIKRIIVYIKNEG